MRHRRGFMAKTVEHLEPSGHKRIQQRRACLFGPDSLFADVRAVSRCASVLQAKLAPGFQESLSFVATPILAGSPQQLTSTWNRSPQVLTDSSLSPMMSHHSFRRMCVSLYIVGLMAATYLLGWHFHSCQSSCAPPTILVHKRRRYNIHTGCHTTGSLIPLSKQQALLPCQER